MENALFFEDGEGERILFDAGNGPMLASGLALVCVVGALKAHKIPGKCK